LAVCQTGRDLFVPLVVLRSPADGVGDLVRRALLPGRPYLVVAPPDLRPALEEALHIQAPHVNVVYGLEPGAFRPVLNAMVQQAGAAYRYEIRVRGHTVAAAGVDWFTDTFAHVYAYTSDDYHGRGWGKAVGASCVQDVLADSLLPLYTAAEENVAAQALAASLGFQDSAAREFECQAFLSV
jgi:hypothetical protein